MPGRKVDAIADKRIRVTAATFTRWRIKRRLQGFNYDEDFAKYLLDSIGGLPMPNLPAEDGSPVALSSSRSVPSFVSRSVK